MPIFLAGARIPSTVDSKAVPPPGGVNEDGGIGTVVLWLLGGPGSEPKPASKQQAAPRERVVAIRCAIRVMRGLPFVPWHSYVDYGSGSSLRLSNLPDRRYYVSDISKMKIEQCLSSFLTAQYISHLLPNPGRMRACHDRGKSN